MDNQTSSRESCARSRLQTSRTVHREAYDIMVKTNRFIRIQIQSVNVSLYTLFIWSQLPIVTMDREYTAQFKSSVLQVRMEAESRYDGVPVP